MSTMKTKCWLLIDIACVVWIWIPAMRVPSCTLSVVTAQPRGPKQSACPLGDAFRRGRLTAQAKEIIDATDVKGGLIVHLGCRRPIVHQHQRRVGRMHG